MNGQKFRQGRRIDGRIQVRSDRDMRPVITMPETLKAISAIIFQANNQTFAKG
jgi:hypothetical protein